MTLHEWMLGASRDLRKLYEAMAELRGAVLRAICVKDDLPLGIKKLNQSHCDECGERFRAGDAVSFAGEKPVHTICPKDREKYRVAAAQWNVTPEMAKLRPDRYPAPRKGR